MGYKDLGIFAVLKLEKKYMLGRVISFSSDEIVLHSASEFETPIESIQYLDVFAKGKIYFKDIKAKIISDEKFIDDRSFSKMIIRKLRLSFNESEIPDLSKMVVGR